MSANLPQPSSEPIAPVHPQVNADVQALLKHNAFRGYQFASAAAPPLYIGLALVRRRHLSFNRLLSATGIGGVAGAVAGLGVGTMQYGNAPGDQLTSARAKLAYDAKQIRLNDYCTLGGILGAVLTPALLYTRTRLVWSIFGGAGLGVGTGTITHYWRSWQERKPLI